MFEEVLALLIFPKENLLSHDDVIKWKHFPRYWPFVRGIHRSTVNSPHKGQWRGALMFSLICVWINGWVNNHEAGDLRRCSVHCDVIVMYAISVIENPYIYFYVSSKKNSTLNTLRPRQNGRQFADDILKCVFLIENVWISIKISLKFVSKGPIINSWALVHIMAWCRPADKPLSEPMVISLMAHICVTRPQWDKQF